MPKTQCVYLPWVDPLRVLTAFAVVVLHVSAYVVTEAKLGSLQWWVGNVLDSSVRWCVPVFVLISGALLLDPAKEEGLLTFYRKRAKRLVIPLVFWSLFYLAFRYCRGEALTTKQIVEDVLRGQPYYHLWYLYMVAGLYALTPFMRTYIRTSFQKEREMLVVLTLVFSGLSSLLGYLYLETHTTIFGLFVPYIGYYLCGYHIRSRSEIGFSSPSLLAVILITVAIIAVGTFYLVGQFGFGVGLLLYDAVSLPVILLSVALFLLVHKMNGACTYSRPFQNVIRQLAPVTLGIYVIHPVVLVLLRDMGLSSTSFTPFLSIPLISVLVFVFSWLSAFVIYQIPHVRGIVS